MIFINTDTYSKSVFGNQSAVSVKLFSGDMKYGMPLDEFIYCPFLFLSVDKLFINKFQTPTNI